MHRLKVLIVENNDLMAETLEDLLTEAEADVVGTVGSLAATLGVLAECPVDVVSLDINLGMESGFPIADVLAARGIPFVFVTTYAASTLPAAHRDRPLVNKMKVHEELLRTCHIEARRVGAETSDGCTRPMFHKGTSKNTPVNDGLAMDADVLWFRRVSSAPAAPFGPLDGQAGG